MRFLSPVLALSIVVSATATAPQDPIIAVYRDSIVRLSELQSFDPGSGKRRLDLPTRVHRLVLERELVRQACESDLPSNPDIVVKIEAAEREIAAASYRRYVNSAIEVTNEDIRRRYEKNRHIYQHPKLFRLQNIFLRFPSHANETGRQAIRDEAHQLIHELSEGADFTTIAERRSDSQTRHSMGFIGFVRPGQLDPEIERIAFALERGEISEPIEGVKGITIIKCVAIKPARTRSFEEVAANIRNTIIGEAADNAVQRVESELAAQAGLVTYPAPSIFDPDAIAARCRWGAITNRGLERLIRGPETDARASAARRWSILEGSAHRAYSLDLADDPESSHRTEARIRRILAEARLSQLARSRLIPPSNQDVKAFWSENRARYSSPATTRLSVIRFAGAPASTSERLEQAWLVHEKLVAGESTFKAASTAFSDHPSAADGGLLPAMTGREIAALGFNVVSEADRLRVGETSRPVVDGSTVWLIRVDARTRTKELPKEEALSKARRTLERRNASAARDSAAAELLKELAVEIITPN